MNKIKTISFAILLSVISITGGYLYSANLYKKFSFLKQLSFGMEFATITLFLVSVLVTIKETYFNRGKDRKFRRIFGEATVITVFLWGLFIILLGVMIRLS